jgi:anti-sigma regulatory factor (Ser/Thr protein kinase)
MQARITIPATRTAPTTARRWVDDVAHALHPDVLGDLRLIVTELVTNAVKYGPGDPIHVCLHVRPPDVARGVVIDQGERSQAIRLRSPGPEAPGGRGLRIVDGLARSWGVDDGSTHVWFVVGPARPAEPRDR